MDKMLVTLSKSLKSNGHSLTKARKAVFIALLDTEPQTMSELAARVGDKADRASIYRTIALFERLGITERLQMGWKYKIELSETFADHHHHLTCIQCGNVTSFEESPAIEDELEEIAQKARFATTGHQLEIRGLCSNCQV
jgi:Fur family ferric uptake transcriptional regulator